MKLLFVLLGISFSLTAQTSITVIVKTDKVIEKAYAYDLSQKEHQKAAYKDTLSFRFHKNQVDCYNLRYFEGEKVYSAQLWLNNGDITIYAHPGKQALVIDSVINSPFYYYVDRLFDYLYSLKDSTDLLNTVLLEAFRENADNVFSMALANHYLGANQNNKAALRALQPLLKEQGDRFSWFLLYEGLGDRLEKLLSREVIDTGRFRFKDTGGKISALKTENDEVTVLDFWFLGCPPCIEDHKSIHLWKEKLKEKNIRFISISKDPPEKEKTWRSYLLKNGYDWENYIEPARGKLSRELNLSAYPTYIILGRKGEILAYYNDFERVLKHLDIQP